jgi:hypothetical protein
MIFNWGCMTLVRTPIEKTNPTIERTRFPHFSFQQTKKKEWDPPSRATKKKYKKTIFFFTT